MSDHKPTRLEQTTMDYWMVSSAVRAPDAPGLSCTDALSMLNSSDRLRPEEWRLTELMHVIRYDIIEGNTKWREQLRVANSVSILPTRG